MDLLNLVKGAADAAYGCAALSTRDKNRALLALARALRERREEIAEVNAKEVAAARGRGLSPALTDRLDLNERRFEEMCAGVEKVAELVDPVGQILGGRVLENGLRLYKKRVPLGLIGVIYEARPNVTIDIAALCLKSGNGCLLRGGSEAFETNLLLSSIAAGALEECGLDPRSVTFIPSTERELVSRMLKLDEYIDVIIPRGGESLQRLCRRESSIPVITGGFGVSHIFVDESADLKGALEIILNAKCQKPSACNAVDTVLVHRAVAGAFLPGLLEECGKRGITVVAHGELYAQARDLGCRLLERGGESDFDTEFLALKFNLAAVGDVNEACAHLKRHKASHSDAILTDSRRSAAKFVVSAGSACVYVNASTRFSDGGQFGLGAEVAISTQKLHARGPMALEELTTTQYVASGDYLIRG